jgi:HEAT repeat protein
MMVAAGELVIAASLPELTAQLESKNAGKRVEAAQALGQTKNPEAIPILARYAADPKSSVRLAVVQAVAAIGSSAAIELLLKTLSDKDSDIRLASVQGLQGLKKPETITPLSGLLTDKELDIRLAVVEAIAGMNSERSLAPLEKAVSDKDVKVRIRVIQVTTPYGNPALSLIVSCLSDRNSDVRCAAANALRRIPHVSSIESLQKVLTDSELKVRIAVIGALGIIATTSAVDALIPGLQDKDPVARAYVCGILGAIRDPAAVSALMNTLTFDSAASVRVASAKALARIGNLNAMDSFNELLAGSNDLDKPALLEAAIDLFAANVNVVAAPSVQPPADPQQIQLMRAYYGAAIGYYKKGMYKEAVAEWEKVLAIDPNHEQSKKNIDISKKKLKEKH